jgi:hypothetical protein
MGSVKVRNTTVNGGMTGRDKTINKVFAFKNGKSYSQMKIFATGSLIATSAQQAVRDTFAQTSAGWSALSDSQRSAWNLASPDWVNTDVFGDKKQSGKNLFTGCNIALVSAGRSKILVPGNKQTYSLIGDVELTVIGGAITFEAVTPNLDPADTIVVAVTNQLSAGTSVFQKTIAISSYVGSSSTSINIDMTFAYEAKYGALIAGRKIGWDAYIMSSGGNKTLLGSGLSTIEL